MLIFNWEKTCDLSSEHPERPHAVSLTSKWTSVTVGADKNVVRHSGEYKLSMVEHQFEPMGLGMVLDRSFRLYTENFPLMFGITAILHAPILLLAFLPAAIPYIGRSSFLGAIAIFSTAIVGLLTQLIIYPLSTGATTKAVSDKYLGNPVTVGSALSEVWANVGTLLLTQFVVGLVVMVGFMLLVVPGILWMLSYALVPPVIMIEASSRTRKVFSLTGKPKGNAPLITDRGDIRKRSWELVRGNRGRVFLVLLVFWVMSMLVSTGGGWFAGLFLEPTSAAAVSAQSIVSNIIEIVILPLQTIAITLLYYDLRIRKEGFDLEMLSQAMGTPAVNT
jgi:hypothetical protein